MFRKILFSLGIALVTSGVGFAQDNTLRGTVKDNSGQPMDYVNVRLMQNGSLITGTTTNDDGSYTIKPIPSGKYDLVATSQGYATITITGIEIRGGITKYQDVVMSSSSTEIVGVEVKATKMMFEAGDVSKAERVSSEDIEKLPTRSLSGILENMSGVVGSGSSMSVRGGRPGEVTYYVDGVPTSSVPQGAIGQVSFIQGAISAEYGDATAVVEIETRGVSNKLSGQIGAFTHIDGYISNELTFGLTGPLVKAKNKEGKDNPFTLGFLLSGEGFYTQGGAVRGGTYYATDETIDYLANNPFRVTEQGNVLAYNAQYVTKYQEGNILSLAEKKQRLLANSWSTTARVMGKLDFRFKHGVDLSLSGNLDYAYGKSASVANILYNSINNGMSRTLNWRLNARLQHFLKLDKDAKIKNAYYRLQGFYTRSTGESYSHKHKDNLFDYGYIGKFEHTYDKSYDYVDNTTPYKVGDDYYYDVWVHQTNYSRSIKFTPGDKNPELARYTQFAFEQYGDLGNDDNIQAAGALLNGQFPSSSTLTYVGFTAPGVPYNGYGRSLTDRLGAKALFSFDVQNHSIKFGFDFEQTTYHSYSISPASLWTVMRANANKHIEQLDVNNPILETDENGIFTGYISFDRLYNESAQSQFDKSLREKLGLAANSLDWVDVDAYDPNFYSLDMFSAEELFYNGNEIISFYGYNYADYKGKSLVSRPITMNDMKNWFSDNSATRDFSSIGAFKPLRISAYIMDNFSIRSLYFNLGLRLDVFDLNQPVVKDMYLYREAFTVEEAIKRGNLNEADVPDFMRTGDYYVYVKNQVSENMPAEVTAYRNGMNWYNADGQLTTDPDKLASSSGDPQLYPLFKTPPPEGDNKDVTYVHYEAFEDYTPTFANGGISLSPRVAFSFAVGEKSKFTASYNIMTNSVPYILRPVDYLYFSTKARASSSSPLSNPGLKPEKTIEYQIGFNQMIGNNLAIDFSAYYRENRDKVTMYNYLQAYPESYYSYTNMDFGTTQGVQVGVQARQGDNFYFTANYSIQFAKGTGSTATSAATLIASGQPNLRTLTTLSYDQRHSINATLNYDFGSTYKKNYVLKARNVKVGKKVKEYKPLEGVGVTLTLKAGSGLPYTRSSEVYSSIVSLGQRQVEGSINGSRLPWSFNADLKVWKTFMFNVNKKEDGSAHLCGLELSITVSNLLGFKQARTAYSYTGEPDDDGFLTSTKYQSYIAARESVQSFWDYYTIMMNQAWNNPWGAPTTAEFGIRFTF
ncbi:MAG: carboxypeptidase regulatory-like domain-containing protein [Bacteroidales bacterium]|jgi:hypothetical protein|nr:carboxypeptidase regulatory-like domain-containing protein [Bacteroidales bacterium]